MGEGNADAWSLFCAAASRERSTIDGKEREHFTLDWTLVRLLLDVRGSGDPEETVEQVVALWKGLNAA